jgi:L-Ala-D/L-Glu epimerase / N-acetyl-D-glutamate racemase
MKITQVNFIPHQLRRKVHWQTASYSADSVLALYVTITTDAGLTGIGASSVMPKENSTFKPGIQTLTAAARQLFAGRDPLSVAVLMDQLDYRVAGYSRHKVALEIALYDLAGKIQNASVATLLGGARRQTVPVLKMLGMGTSEWMANRAAQFVTQGYRNLKVKLGSGPEIDCERFRAIRRAVGAGVALTADFNGAYDATTAIKVIEGISVDGLSMVEQPVPALDLAGMAAVTRAVQPIVLADQSVDSPEDVAKIARGPAAKAVSIKLLKLGGIQKSLAVVKACEEAGLACHVGGTGTSRLVEAAQAHFISATPAVLVPAEIAEFEELDGDLVKGFEVVNGVIQVPQGPGLGVSLESEVFSGAVDKS